MIPVAWPLAHSGSGRYLVDQAGRPFPILGRTAWGVISNTAANYIAFLDDTVARGYNAVELGLIWHDSRTANVPFCNNGGSLPFATKIGGGTYTGSPAENPDFTSTTTGSAVGYWNFVDGFITACLARGILVLGFPMYHGFQGTDQGWQTELDANGQTRCNTYGAFVSDRYKTYGNIVWGFAGDAGTGSEPFTTSQRAAHQGLITGMQSVSGQLSTLMFAEWDTETIFDDGAGQFTFTGGAVTYKRLQSAYSFVGDVANQCRRGWSANNGATFLMEEPFDQEGPGPDGNGVNSDATQPVRRFQWWGWLSAIGGYNSGNGFVWPFNSGTWQSHLNTQNAQDQKRMNEFIRSIAWHTLIPSGLSGMRSLVVSGGSTVSATDYVAAACAQDGKALVVYIPPAHSGAIGVDLRSMAGPSRARWFDPTANTYSTNASAAGTFTLANTASSQSFTPPATNAAGDADFILHIDTQANPTGPGVVWCG